MKTIVLFPGAWGNRRQEVGTWWLRIVHTFFLQAGWRVKVLTYSGNSLEEYARSVLEQLDEFNESVDVFCYSLGAQVARRVHELKPEAFKSVVLFGGLERRGISIFVLLKVLLVMFWPILRSAFTGSIRFDNRQQIQRTIFHGADQPTAVTLARLAQDRFSHAEPFRIFLDIALPFTKRELSPFGCPVMAIVPTRDFFVSGASYQDEGAEVVYVQGDHGLLLQDSAKALFLDRTKTWLNAH